MGGKLWRGALSPLHPGNWRVLRPCIAEFFGTAILLICGIAACLNWTDHGDHNALLRIGITFGFTLTGIILAIGPISGAHVNPVVTLAFLILGKLPLVQAILYMAAQFLGAIAGSGLLYFSQHHSYFGEDSKLFGLTQVNDFMRINQGLFVEIIGTSFLVLGILLLNHSCWKEVKAGAAVAIGSTLAVLEFAFVSATGGSFNPARSVGPAVIVWNFNQLWVYFVGPILGALLAVVLYKLLTYDGKLKQFREEPAWPTTSTITDSVISCDPLEDPHCELFVTGGKKAGATGEPISSSSQPRPFHQPTTEAVSSEKSN